MKLTACFVMGLRGTGGLGAPFRQRRVMGAAVAPWGGEAWDVRDLAARGDRRGVTLFP